MRPALHGGVVSAGQGVSLSTGAIDGTVTDATGAVLAGVMVALRRRMVQPRSACTDADGGDRFPALPPGTYALVLTRRPDSRTARREAIRVDVGFTATIDVVIELETVPEQITVAATVAIDRPALPTAVATTFNASSPAAARRAKHVGHLRGDAGHSADDVRRRRQHGGEWVSPTAFGISGNNRPMVEGIDTTGVQGTGFTFDYGSFDEVLVTTAAHAAEWPKPGVQSQIHRQVGRDRYRGSVYADYENRAWQSFNIDADHIARGAPHGGGLGARDANRLWS